MKNKILIIMLFMMLGCSSIEVSKKKEHYLIRGMNYSKTGNYTKAIEEYKEFYKIDKKDLILLREMGLAYAQLSEYSLAEKYYLEALEIEPEDQLTLINISILYYKIGDFKKSKKYISKISSDNMDYRIFLLKGFIAFDEKDYEVAYENLSKVINLIKVEDYTFVEKYVEVLKETKRTNEIYPFIYKVYQAQKNNPIVVIDYSRFLIDIFGDYDGAFKVLKAYNAKEKNDRIILELAIRSFEVGKIKDSEAYLKLLTDAYLYDVNVLQLKRDIALKNKKYSEADKYTKILEKVSDLENGNYKD